jgi:hypothetical protein
LPPLGTQILVVKLLVRTVHNNPTSEEGKMKELTAIQHTLYKDECPHDCRKTPFRNRTNYKINTRGEEQSKKRITFTNIGKETRSITKIFKNTDIRITFKTSNTIERNLHNRAQRIK